MPKPPLVSVRHLSVTYFPGRSNEVRALRDVSLEVNEGEFIIFFGPSGCGKSTLLYSIAGLERNIEGEVTVGGNDIAACSERELEEFHRRTVGMIFQSFYLIGSLSVLKNIVLPGMVAGSSRSGRERKARKLLERFGVSRQAGKLPSELSGGQQQRVAICRALMNDPAILMADEPVGNLDSAAAAEVMRLLREVNDRHGKTVLLVTHDPSHLHHAHRIYYLGDGKITGVKENTPEERHRSFVSAAQRHVGLGLEHWMRTLPAAAGESDAGTLAVLKAHDLLTGFFSGFTGRELARLEAHVQLCLLRRNASTEAIRALLVRPAEQGGFSMHARKAGRLAAAVTRAAAELRALRAIGKRRMTPAMRRWAQAQAVRRFVLDDLAISMRPSRQRLAIDKAIHDRLGEAGTFRTLLRSLELPPPDGAGLDRRLARKFARRAEGLVSTGTSATLQAPLDEDDVSLAVIDSTESAGAPSSRAGR